MLFSKARKKSLVTPKKEKREQTKMEKQKTSDIHAKAEWVDDQLDNWVLPAKPARMSIISWSYQLNHQSSCENIP